MHPKRTVPTRKPRIVFLTRSRVSRVTRVTEFLLFPPPSLSLSLSVSVSESKFRQTGRFQFGTGVLRPLVSAGDCRVAIN